MFFLEPPTRLAVTPHATPAPAWTTPRRTAWSEVYFRGREIGAFLEGPAFAPDGVFYFTDIPGGRIFRVDEAREVHLHVEYDGWPNGLKITATGRFLVADHRLGLVEIEADGTPRVLAEGYRGERFRGLNDLTVGGDGWVYFTDQGQSGLQEPSGSVYRYHLPTHRLERVLTGIPSPNGLALARDETALFVTVTRANAVWRLPFVMDGGVSKVGTFLNLSGGGGPDGLAVDQEDGLVVAQPGLGVLRFDALGMLTHFVEIPRGSSASNIAYGGEDGRTLFITDSHGLRILTTRMPYAGHPMG